MHVRKVHLGHYLLCRVEGAPNKTVGISMPVSSPSGAIIQLSVYNHPILPASLGQPTDSDVDAAFPVGGILAIKEPYVKMAATGDSPLLRVDSPSDLMFVPRNHRMLKGVQWSTSLNFHDATGNRTPEQWKNLGNKVRSLHLRLWLPRLTLLLRSISHPRASSWP